MTEVANLWLMSCVMIPPGRPSSIPSRVQTTQAKDTTETAGDVAEGGDDSFELGGGQNAGAQLVGAPRRRRGPPPKAEPLPGDIPRNRSDLLEKLDSLPETERNALVKKLFSDHRYMRSALSSGEGRGATDRQAELRAIGNHFSRARASGAISGDDVKSIVQKMGGRSAIQLALTMRASNDPGATTFLEEMGTAAREASTGDRFMQQASDLALTANTELTNKHFPDEASRSAAARRLSTTFNDMHPFAGRSGRNRTPRHKDRATFQSQVVASIARLVPENDREPLIGAIDGLPPEQVGRVVEQLAANEPEAAGRIMRSLPRNKDSAKRLASLVADKAKFERLYPTAELRTEALAQLTAGLEAREAELGLTRAKPDDPEFRAMAEAYETIWRRNGNEILDFATAEGRDSKDRDKYARLDELQEGFRHFLFSLHTPKNLRESVAGKIEKWISDRPDTGPQAGVEGYKIGLVLSRLDGAFKKARAEVKDTGYLSAQDEFFARFLGKTLGNVVSDLVESSSVTKYGKLAGRLLGALADAGYVTGEKFLDRTKVQEQLTQRFLADLREGGGDAFGERWRRLNNDLRFQLLAGIEEQVDELRRQGKPEEAERFQDEARRTIAQILGVVAGVQDGRD